MQSPLCRSSSSTQPKYLSELNRLIGNWRAGICGDVVRLTSFDHDVWGLVVERSHDKEVARVLYVSDEHIKGKRLSFSDFILSSELATPSAELSQQISDIALGLCFMVDNDWWQDGFVLKNGNLSDPLF